MTFASKHNLCACTYTLFSFKPTRLHIHAKQNLFKHVFLFLWCLQEFLLPPVLLMLPSYLIVKGVSYRSLADNTDGQCPSQGSCLGLRLNFLAQCIPTASQVVNLTRFSFCSHATDWLWNIQNSGSDFEWSNSCHWQLQHYLNKQPVCKTLCLVWS